MADVTSSNRPVHTPEVPPGTGRAIIIGTILGFFIVGGFCAAASVAAGLPLDSSLVIGLFTGAIGGPGFGGMMGFVLHDSRLSEH